MAFQIDPDVCTACGDCQAACPTQSISPFKGMMKIDITTCTECEDEADMPKCLDACMEDDCILPAD